MVSCERKLVAALYSSVVGRFVEAGVPVDGLDARNVGNEAPSVLEPGE